MSGAILLLARSTAGKIRWKLPNGQCKGLPVVGLKALAAQ
jgi:hypothetical protein